VKAHTDYLWFNTAKRHELVNITDRIAEIVEASGIQEGMCLVSAMHITAGIWVNDEESGLKHDVMVWLEKLAPAGDYRHHQTGEDNADAHLKRTLVHHQVVLPITKGAYAGPVTEGNTDVTELRLPSLRMAFSVGTMPERIAASSVSGRAPSATRMITGTRSSGESRHTASTFPRRGA